MFDKKFDIGGIMAKVKKRHFQSNFDTAGSETEEISDYYIEELSKREPDLYNYRQVIEERKVLGSKIPQFLRFNSLTRMILLFGTKVIYKAAFLITREQNIVNQHLLLCIDRLTESIHLLKSARKADIVSIQNLETTVSSLQARINNLETTISNMQNKQAEPAKVIGFNDVYTFGGMPYFDFETRHRGSSQAIEERMNIYLEYLESINFKMEGATAVDIGCGKGDWLRLVTNAGAQAIGIDLDENMVKYCERENMRALKIDAVAYFKSLPPNSVDLISGFHIIEHLPMAILVELLGEAGRVLRSGGFLIMETPNSQNAITGLYNFYADPTHIKPIHFEWIRYILEKKGFAEVIDLLPLSKMATTLKIVDKAVVESDMPADVIGLLRKTNSMMNAPVNLGITARKG